MKDWTGNKKTTFTCLGASNHSEHEREVNDYYATDPKAAELLLEVEPELDYIWECACGDGAISKVLIERGYDVVSTDLFDYGYGKSGVDFLRTSSEYRKELSVGTIITNPPYSLAKEFVEHSMDLLNNDEYCIMLLKIQFLEGKARKELFNKII